MSGEGLSLNDMQAKASEAAEFMRLFSTPSRLILLCYISEKERSVGEIQDGLDFRQPALSQHLGELRQAGVVQTRRESRQIYYSIADGRVSVVMDMLTKMYCGVAATSVLVAGKVSSQTATLSTESLKSSFAGEMARWARLEPDG